jgi:hypothetical protein
MALATTMLQGLLLVVVVVVVVVVGGGVCVCFPSGYGNSFANTLSYHSSGLCSR